MASKAKNPAKFKKGKKLCRKCGVYKPFTSEFFHVQNRRECGLHSNCKSCTNAYSAKYRSKFTLEVLVAYSRSTVPSCICCGESDASFLCIDHINGGGTQEIKKFNGLYYLLLHLKNSGYPKGYQVLCHNCNNSKSTGEKCVHKRESLFKFLFSNEYKKRKSSRKPNLSTVIIGRTDVKMCSGCLEVKPATFEYFTKQKNGLYGLKSDCKSCYSEYRHQYVKETRYKALVHFSLTDAPECLCCGESELEFLCIDHIEGGGKQHRKEMGGGNHQISSVNGFLKMIKDPDKDKYQILCWNCNFSKHKNGECSHKQKN